MKNGKRSVELDTEIPEKDVAEGVKARHLEHPKPEHDFTDEKLKIIDFSFHIENLLPFFIW